MKSQLYTLSKIFTERLFRIPDYQRGYAWTRPQLDDFWNDISQLDSGQNHYTGVLTLESVPEDTIKQWTEDEWIIDSKGYEPLYIVDGQQRLTTSIILIQTIIENTNKNRKLNYTLIKDVQKNSYLTQRMGESPDLIFLDMKKITRVSSILKQRYLWKIHQKGYLKRQYTHKIWIQPKYIFKSELQS